MNAAPLAFGLAVLWPLAAGLALVLFTKWRAAKRDRALAPVEARLKAGYGAIEASPIPRRLSFVIEVLEETAAACERPSRPVSDLQNA
ncbi:hypothetical protein [Phenylobacterium sp.]|uniref:hypothetical protein n=1 Tax=Phenylobacterium sp. TaxID=1871053 RepID=UPI0035B2790B